ncbi:MAG: hypothetical protein K9K39_10250, partial [Desulfohalobiaceae bacterium]|nr:hypothetical protein [Desulfohalobiaceae bacterium]
MNTLAKKGLKRVDAGEQKGRTGMDRRSFLRGSGLVLGGGALMSVLPAPVMLRAEASEVRNIPQEGVETKHRRTICTHCSVGCGVIAEVQNGVWTGQEPDFDSPINLGSHCTKGASLRHKG